MDDTKIIVGVDIGSSKISAVTGKKNKKGKIEVIGIETSNFDGVNNGIIANINKTVNSIKEVITNLDKKIDIDIKIINSNLSGKHIRCEFQKGNIIRDKIDNEINSKDIIRLTNDMYKQVMPYGNIIAHVLPQYYTIDNSQNIKDPIGMPGIKLEGTFNIITADNNAVESIKKCIKKNNLILDSLIINSIASSNAILSKEEKEMGVCLIDIGAGVTDIAIFQNSVLTYTSVIPHGGNIITNDIKQAFGITEKQAELLKIKFGGAISSNTSDHKSILVPNVNDRNPKEISTLSLTKIIEARLEEFIEIINCEIQNYIPNLNSGIVLTGGTSCLPKIDEFFEYNINLETRIGNSSKFIADEENKYNNPEYATGIGLMISGFHDLTSNITSESNFSYEHNNPKIKKKKDFLRRIFEKTKGLLIDDYLE